MIFRCYKISFISLLSAISRSKDLNSNGIVCYTYNDPELDKLRGFASYTEVANVISWGGCGVMYRRLNRNEAVERKFIVIVPLYCDLGEAKEKEGWTL